ncbi:unnamed protein product [Paramecium sonneborni]|uniref:Protein kinase domain-containing protein n=1 Tax=Paramecium sonneborni TaxID=65129 RepID=A0A8S1NRB2_9CILI|nr:unnamed protein product [Paramecium sonneborni]
MLSKRLHHKTYSSETSPLELYALSTQRDQHQFSKSPTFHSNFKTNKQITFQKPQLLKQNASPQQYQQSKTISKFQQQDLLKSKGFISPQSISSTQILLQSNLINKQQYPNQIKTQPQSQHNTQYQNFGVGLETEDHKTNQFIQQNQKPSEIFQIQQSKKNSLSQKQKTEIAFQDLLKKQYVDSQSSNPFHPIQQSLISQNSQMISLHQNLFHSKSNGLSIVPILQCNSPQETLNELQQFESLTARKNTLLLIILQYKMFRLKLQIETSNKTIQNLIDLVSQEIYKNFKDLQLKIIGIQTYNLYIPIDYILSLSDKPLIIFDNCQIRPLVIKPVFEIENEIQTSKVSLKDFEFIKCIGMGGFSKVYLVKERKTGKYFAMKLIEKNPIIQQNRHSIIQNERNIMCLIDHPFIVKMQFAFESKTFFVFVQEYCSGGELFFLLRKIKRMSEKDAFFYFSEICLGMKTLHSNNVIYRDIKPENILIDLDGHIRIADFGLSKPDMIDTENAYSFCGSSEYMAPEMLLKSGHTFQLDLYCLGALLYELITGLPPFYSRNLDEIYQRILHSKLTFPPQLQLSSSIKHLLTNLLAKNPKDRIDSIDTLLNHPWMTQWGDSNLYKDIYLKKFKPPHSPDYFSFNFDEKEFGKGESEFLAFIKPLQQSMQENFPKETILKEFYYQKQENLSEKEVQINQKLQQKKNQKQNIKQINNQEENHQILQNFQIYKNKTQQRFITEVEQKQQGI